MILDTPEQIKFFRTCVIFRGLGAEIKGLKMSRGSCYAMAKREFGFKGNKVSVYNQLADLLGKDKLAV